LSRIWIEAVALVKVSAAAVTVTVRVPSTALVSTA
jgi:hypothetical protein